MSDPIYVGGILHGQPPGSRGALGNIYRHPIKRAIRLGDHDEALPSTPVQTYCRMRIETPFGDMTIWILNGCDHDWQRRRDGRWCPLCGTVDHTGTV